MALDFQISGGSLRIRKKTFVRELLSPASPLKTLLNYELEDSGKTRILTVDRNPESEEVVIDFTEGSNVSVGEDFTALLSRLKSRYAGDVRGRITLMANYYTALFVVLDLDGPGEEMRTIHQ